MKKDRNRPDSHRPDYSLPRSKILRGRKNFQRLFEISTVLNSDSIQFRYRIYSDPNEGCFIGFAAPKKKISSAVKRNRIKRLLREVYRHQQSHLNDLFEKSTFGFHGLFLANRPELSYADIEADMIPLLKNVRNRLLRTTQGSANEPPSTDETNLN
jgi:ribonuclease P protein component